MQSQWAMRAQTTQQSMVASYRQRTPESILQHAFRRSACNTILPPAIQSCLWCLGHSSREIGARSLVKAFGLALYAQDEGRERVETPSWLQRRAVMPRRLEKRLGMEMQSLKMSIAKAAKEGDSKLAEYLQRVLQRKQCLKKRYHQASTLSTHKVAQAILSLSTVLDVPLDTALDLTTKCDRLTASNPTHIRSSVSALCNALQCTRAEALSLASINPNILFTTPSVIHSHIPALLSTFKVSPRQLYAMLQQRPELITQSPAMLARKMAQLADLLSVTQDTATRLVVNCPRVTRSSSSTLRLKFARLQQMLSLEAALATELVRKEPRVLCVSSNVLQQQLERLFFKFALFQDEVVDMLLADPSMLFDQQQDETMEWGEEEGGANRAQQPSGRRKANLVKDMVQLAELMEIPPTSFLTMAAQLKLDMQPDELRTGLQALSKLLGITLKDAALMVTREPRILSWSSAQQPLSLPDAVTPHQQDDSLVQVKLGSSNAYAVEGSGAAAGVSASQQRTSPVPWGTANASPSSSPHTSSTGEEQVSLVVGVDDSSNIAGRSGSVSSTTSDSSSTGNIAESSGAAVGVQRSNRSGRKPYQPALQGTSLAEAKRLLYHSLGLMEGAATKLLTMAPELLIRPPTALSNRLLLLQDLMQLHPGALAEVVVAVPQLLLEPEGKLRQRLKDLSTVFRSLAPSQLAELIAREPQMMALPAAVLSRRYQKLAAQIGLFEDDMLDIVLADPSVLMSTVDEF